MKSWVSTPNKKDRGQPHSPYLLVCSSIVGSPPTEVFYAGLLTYDITANTLPDAYSGHTLKPTSHVFAAAYRQLQWRDRAGF